MYLEFEVVTDKAFPDGLRCMECGRIIDVGQPFKERPEGSGPNSDLVSLICVYC